MKRMISSLLLLTVLSAPVFSAAVPSAVRQVVVAYYAAMEKEDLAAVRQLSAVPADDPMFKVLVGVFLATDVQIRDLEVKDFVADADGRAGTALVSLKARVSDLEGGNAYDQERDLAIVMTQDAGQWKVVKVWREMDYRMAVRLVRLNEESNRGGPPPITQETFEKLPPNEDPGGVGGEGGGPEDAKQKEEDHLLSRLILGTWHWRHRVTTIFLADGTIHGGKGASWRLVNAAERRFAITFRDGMQADVTMDGGDSTVLSGKDDKGGDVWARRIYPKPQWEDRGPGPMVFADKLFRKGDWSVCSAVSGGAGSRFTERREAPGRDAYCYVRHVLNDAAKPEWRKISACHTYMAKVYDPGLNGAIHSIDYEDTSILFSGHPKGQRWGPMLCQGATYYIYQPRNPEAIPFVASKQWIRNELRGLTPADFIPVDSLGQEEYPMTHPDFSASGDQIMFGFFRGATTKQTGGAATSETGTDDWKVTVHRSPASVGQPVVPDPEPEAVPEGWKKVVHKTHPHTYCIPQDWGAVDGDVKGNVIQAYRSPKLGGTYVSVLHVPVAAPLDNKQLEGTIPLSLAMGGLFGRLVDKKPLEVGGAPALLNRFAGTFMGFPTQTFQLVASRQNSLFYLAVVTAANNAQQEATARQIIGTFRFAQ